MLFQILAILVLMNFEYSESSMNNNKCVVQSLTPQELEWLEKTNKWYEGALTHFYEIAESLSDSEFKRNCESFMSPSKIMQNLFETRAKNCFNENTLQSMQKDLDGKTLICDFDSDTRKAFFEANNNVKCTEFEDFHEPCLNGIEDLCNPDDSETFMGCIEEKVDSVVSCDTSKKEMMIKYYKNMLNFSRQQSLCEKNHALVDGHKFGVKNYHQYE